ncbi:MAG: tRNA (N6-isopentenyl adenosine(37)-C2)-methylthiotransferase MiaB [Spirochaetales bacterium]|nr:tRNA (N6-isopentenyl adenosine(37)-C2)-methylthiotransferase MiaB [Spirochaetales bacterium]
MNKQYFIETYGCQMNVAESSALEKKLHDAGWRAASSGEEADVVLLNTCSVRKTAENRIWGRLGHFKRLKQENRFLLGVMGCMTERLGEDIRKEAHAVDFLVGTFGKVDFTEALINGKLNRGDAFFGHEEYEFAREHCDSGEFQAMLPIMHGCDNFCSYCIVPYVRGHEISRKPDEIIFELKKIEKAGVKEVTLIGQNVNSYRFTLEGGSLLDFSGLLRRILTETKIPWIRFISSNPQDLSDDLIDVISKNERICSHIHLPIQHGSTDVLKAMNRKYTREDYLLLVDKMRKNIPDLSLTTDLLIGFPGEREEDYLLTADLIKKVGFEDAYTYQYNAIEGTAAFSYENQVPEAEKKRRLADLIEIQRAISSKIKGEYIGKEVTALVEKISRKADDEVLGRTENNQMVVFAGDAGLIGNMCRVKIKGLSGNTFLGEKICLGD